VNSAQSTATPVVHLTLNGIPATFTDTGQILNTGGFDFGNRLQRNESLQWRLIGTTTPLFPGGGGVRPAAVPTSHNDNARTGLNSSETTLTPASVNATTFGKLFAYPVDGQIYAQPLFAANVAIAEKGLHNVVFVATENNSVYAFDAESNSGNGGLLWGPISLGPTMPTGDICSGNVSPTFGVTGTPVIDTATNTLYVVSKNKLSSTVYVARLHALDLGSGAEKFGGPVNINGSVPGTGDGTAGGSVAFEPKQHFQRSALLLQGGSVYIAFSSHCDIHGYHGWLFGYNAANISQQTAIFNTSPNAISVPATSSCKCYLGWCPAGGAIWMAGAGPAADANGIYAATGNGQFDANTPGGVAYGDTILKVVRSTTTQLTVADYFTPFDQRTLECNDADLGSSGPLLLPGSNPSLLVQVSKSGNIYLVNRATGSMGEYNATCGTPGPSCDHVVQVIDNAITPEVLSSPTYFNGTVYFQGGSDSIKAFELANGVFAPTTPVAQSPKPAGSFSTTSISYDSTASNPTSTAIVWSIEKDYHGMGVLHAFTADTLRELYDADAQGYRDAAGPTVEFTVPTIAAGKVFVGTANRLVVYGGGFFGWSGEKAFPSVPAKQVAVARNQGGALEVFYIGIDTGIYYNYQMAPSNEITWSGQLALGGFAKQIAVGQNKDGRLEVFYVGTDNAIYHNYQTTTNPNTWSGQGSLGGYAKQIAVGQNQDGRLELFYIGTDDALYHNYQTAPNNGWSGQGPLGGYAKQVAVGQNQDGRLELFYVGTDDALYHNYQTAPNNGWSGQGPLGGYAKQIVIGQNQDGRLELFYVGMNDSLYHNYQTAPNNGWSGGEALGGSTATQFAVAQNQDGRLELFYAGMDSAIHHNFQTAPNNGWSGELDLGGFANQIAVGQNQDGRLEIFYVGTDYLIYRNYQTTPHNRWNH
jgi:hypothetical protein